MIVGTNSRASRLHCLHLGGGENRLQIITVRKFHRDQVYHSGAFFYLLSVLLLAFG